MIWWARLAVGWVLLGTMAMAQAMASPTVGQCSWDHPGVDPYMGDVVAAVDRYRDIPADVRGRLKDRMARRDYDDLVSIRRDRIDGRGGYDYGSTISDMHFGTDRLCHSVTRAAWKPDMQERGLVYCDSGQCILVPTVCRNVSRVTRTGVGPESAAALPPLLAAAAPEDPLPAIDWMGPTGAGVPAMPVAPALGSGAATYPLSSATLADGVVSAAGAPLFAGVGAPGGGILALGVPAVSAVPEPASWWLLLAGLPLVGGRRRR